jgi:predicted peptidase
MTASGVQLAREFRQSAAVARVTRYLLYMPPGTRPTGRDSWPLLLFLHGAGERGADLSKVKAHGIPKVIEHGMKLPCVAVSPQCPDGERWSEDGLIALLDELERWQPIDPERVYVTGISMGGAGVWSLAIAQPDRFAAIAPICGRGDPSRVCAIAGVPVWAFHGAKDDVVPVQRSLEMVEALRNCGGNVRFTVYPDAGHDSWTETYANPDLYTWLFAQHRVS